MARKKFGKNISALLFTGNYVEKSRFNTSGLVVTEAVTTNNTDDMIMSVKELKKPVEIKKRRGDFHD